MSIEKNKDVIQSNEVKTSRLAELINPVNLPEAAFQSYEEFKNNATDQKDAFISSEIDNPDLNYSKFKDISNLDKGILKLANTVKTVETLNLKPDYENATKSSLEFRMAEMEYVKLLARIDFVAHESADQDVLRELTEEAKSLNEALYGAPKQEIVDAALNEIFTRVDNKVLSPSAQKIYDELNNGFMWKDEQIAPLSRSSDTEAKLPSFEDESLAWAGEHIVEKNAHLHALVESFWQSKVEEYGDSYTCASDDIEEAFDHALSLLDPERKSGISVVMDPEATALSWDSATLSVKIGAKRKAIVNSEVLFEKILHELQVHGGRAINGLKTDLPVLGTGLFTETSRPDYLTFEEGFATTIEEVVSGERPEWGANKLTYYLNIALAKEGRNFRSVFETAWRYQLLMGVKDNAEVTGDMIQKQKSLAYGRCVRIFRGTQTDLGDKFDIQSMTYNKDLAYLEGRVIAMDYISKLYETKDMDGLDRLFMAKYDPTNPTQDAIVKSVLGVE